MTCIKVLNVHINSQEQKMFCFFSQKVNILTKVLLFFSQEWRNPEVSNSWFALTCKHPVCGDLSEWHVMTRRQWKWAHGVFPISTSLSSPLCQRLPLWAGQFPPCEAQKKGRNRKKGRENHWETGKGKEAVVAVLINIYNRQKTV